MTDPESWNAGDFHRWERVTGPDCPDCPCCTAALCQRATERNSACHHEGRSGDFDLSLCPCWRNAMRTAAAATPAAQGEGGQE